MADALAERCGYCGCVRSFHIRGIGFCKSDGCGCRRFDFSSVCVRCGHEESCHIEEDGKPICCLEGCKCTGFVSGEDVETSVDKEPDMVNNPPHYTFGKFEVIDVIDDWKLGFYEGQVVKYVARAKHKGNEIQDLKKAQYYLNRLVKKMEEPDEAVRNESD